MPEPELVLYGTSGCHLCESAEQVLRQVARVVPVAWRLGDIVEDEALMGAYAERIPVLRLNDRELDWPFGVLDVVRLLRGDSD